MIEECNVVYAGINKVPWKFFENITILFFYESVGEVNKNTWSCAFGNEQMNRRNRSIAAHYDEKKSTALLETYISFPQAFS